VNRACDWPLGANTGSDHNRPGQETRNPADDRALLISRPMRNDPLGAGSRRSRANERCGPSPPLTSWLVGFCAASNGAHHSRLLCVLLVATSLAQSSRNGAALAKSATSETLSRACGLESVNRNHRGYRLPRNVWFARQVGAVRRRICAWAGAVGKQT
jgi:hypothetical protein